MSLLEIFLIILNYLLSAGLIGFALAFSKDAMKPVAKNVLTYTLFVPLVNSMVAIVVCIVLFEMLIFDGKEKGQGPAK